MSVNKVEYKDNEQIKTLIDLTTDTVTPDKLAKGYTAHDMSGNIITGTMESGGKEYTFTNGLTETDGTVSWDLNDKIKAGAGKGSVRINANANDESVLADGDYSLAFGRSGTHGSYAGSKTGINSEGVGSLAFGDLGSYKYYSIIKSAGQGQIAAINAVSYLDQLKIKEKTKFLFII